MFWQDDTDKTPDFHVPDDVVDVLFAVQCRSLPLDHAHALSEAVLAVLPWLADERQAGVHPVHVAESGNGWYRPDDPDNEILHLSKRTKLAIRVPNHRMQDVRSLTGQSLDIAGNSMRVGDSKVRKFTAVSTVFSRYVLGVNGQSEQAFTQSQYETLTGVLKIKVKKMLCGKEHLINGPDGPLTTRSLMLAELELEDSIYLQQHGLGEGRTFGCGLFLPHKSIKAVNASRGE